MSHLYPAREGMLRRGTSVEDRVGRRWVAAEAPRGTAAVFATVNGPALMLRESNLDLRDVTTRAHASMLYTCVVYGNGPAVVHVRHALIDEMYALLHVHGLSNEHAAALEAVHILPRMRAGDETVTVEEARAALDWAHEVTT